jgi:hypothetical protein
MPQTTSELTYSRFNIVMSVGDVGYKHRVLGIQPHLQTVRPSVRPSFCKTLHDVSFVRMVFDNIRMMGESNGSERSQTNGRVTNQPLCVSIEHCGRQLKETKQDGGKVKQLKRRQILN